MSLIDYTSKLNSHKEYIDILEKIQLRCKYIEIVSIDGKVSNKIIEKFSSDVLKIKKVMKWWGTESNRNKILYKIKFSKDLLEFLKTFETFCKYYQYGSTNESLRRGDYSFETDFGLDDIAFYDKNYVCLLCTTTHEGYIMINEEILK